MVPVPQEDVNRNDAAAPSATTTANTVNGHIAVLGPVLCRAICDYAAQDANSLSFREGDIIEILSPPEPSSWWDGLLRGQRGWIPSNYVTLISGAAPNES